MGYVNTATMNENQWYILGLNFENVGAETSFKIKDLLDQSKFTVGTLVSGDTADVATQIQVRNPDNSTTTYFYFNQVMWFDEEGMPQWGDGWACEDDPTFATEDTFEAGTGFWFKQPAGGGAVALNFAGQVLPADSADVHVKPIWQLAANPFPTALKIKDLASDSLTSGDNAEVATQIQIRNPDNSATTYFYFNQVMWFDEEGMPQWGDGWACEDDPTFVTEDTIAPGVGFWIKDPSKTFDIEIKNPTSK